MAVVVSPNIVRMAFYLVMSLAATAGLFFLAGADFVGAMQTLDLRRRHARAAGVRRDAHVAGPVHLDEDEPVRDGHGGRRRRVPVCSCWSCAAWSVPEWRGLTREQVAEAIPLEPTATPIGMGLLGVRGRCAGSRRATC